MKSAHLLRDFVPPILLNVVRKATRKEQCFGMYPSYEDAARVCLKGYEDEDLLRVIYEKTVRLKDGLRSPKPPIIDFSTLRPLVALGLALKKEEIRVIDFGGACGVHYFTAKAVFGERIKLAWRVVETEGLVRKSKALENDELRFFSDLGSAKADLSSVDLFFSAGALQYLASPCEALEALAACQAKNIFLSRLGLTTGMKELITVQRSMLSYNGLGALPEGITDREVLYPLVLSRKDRVEQILNKKYDLRMQMNEDKGAYRWANHSIDLYGYWGTAR
jgi:putative methyltransferase (TIGR04325 family)